MLVVVESTHVKGTSLLSHAVCFHLLASWNASRPLPWNVAEGVQMARPLAKQRIAEQFGVCDLGAGRTFLSKVTTQPRLRRRLGLISARLDVLLRTIKRLNPAKAIFIATPSSPRPSSQPPPPPPLLTLLFHTLFRFGGSF